MRQQAFSKIALSTYTFIAGAAILGSVLLINSESTAQIYEAPWQRLTSYDNRLLLLYPSGWQYSFRSSQTDADSGLMHELVILPKEQDGEPLYAVTINWNEYAGTNDCVSLAQEHVQQIFDSRGATMSEQNRKSIQAVFEPVQSTMLKNNYPACRFPVATSTIGDASYGTEYYEIPHEGRLYALRFPTADSPNTLFLDPAKNNRIAHRILASLKFPSVGDDTAAIDEAIKSYARQNSTGRVRDFTITEKKTFTDNRGAFWLKFTVAPIPEGVTDPAYGVMKQTHGTWEGRGFGTCCIERGLPSDVSRALGFPGTDEP